MKYLLIGCNGKMGKSITKLASNFKDEIECGIDLQQTETTFPVYNSIENISGKFDAVIDFSSQDNHAQYINYAKRMRLPYAIFSTNIDDKTNEAIIDASNKIPILKCSNSSAGANTMFELTQICCKNLKDAETVLTEYHHKNKKDAPSGTAKTLLNILNKNNINPQMQSFRVANEKGKHILEFYLDNETISITHQVFSRDVFAQGALMLMHKLINKKRGLYTYI